MAYHFNQKNTKLFCHGELIGGDEQDYNINCQSDRMDTLDLTVTPTTTLLSILVHS